MTRLIKRSAAVAMILLVMVLQLCFMPSVAYAAEQHLFDDAELMSYEEQQYVEAYLADMSEQLQFDIIAVTTYGYSQSDITSFADDFYDYGGFGYGDGHDGVIFVIDMDAREMVLVTTGYGTEAITDYGEELIYDAVTDNIRSGEYAEALTSDYADTVKDFVEMSRDGAPVDENAPGHDGYDWYQEPEEYNQGSSSSNTMTAKSGVMAGAGGISAIFGVIAGFFSSQRQKSKLKTVRRKTQANSYVRRDSLVITNQRDRFLYSTVAVTPRPKNQNNDDRHHGGGTTMHRGSSGVPHGGGHARGF